MIEIKNVSKSYVRGKKSVDDLNLEIKNGEIFGFLGPNGAGKTTTMEILQSIVMIIVDLKRPKLNWDSEYAVAKQNLNLVFPVLLAMVNIVILVGFVYLLKDINVYMGVGILGILYIVATVITNKYLYNKQYELADKII